jgi:hypothetical protein
MSVSVMSKQTYTKKISAAITYTLENGESKIIPVDAAALSFVRKIVSNYNMYNEIKLSVNRIRNDKVVLKINTSRTLPEKNNFTLVNLSRLPNLKKALTNNMFDLDFDNLLTELQTIKDRAYQGAEII